MIRKIIHHPEAIGIATMATMVFLMSNYNMLWRFGFAHYTFKREMVIYPIVFCVVFIVKNMISAPIVAKIHQHSVWLQQRPRHISFPILVITVNITIVMAIMTYFTRNYIPNHYFTSYVMNWLHTVIVAIPLFFFVVRPIIKKVIVWLRNVYQLEAN